MTLSTAHEDLQIIWHKLEWGTRYHISKTACNITAQKARGLAGLTFADLPQWVKQKLAEYYARISSDKLTG